MEVGADHRPRLQATVVTVHGTWARDAPWARQDSALGQALLDWFADMGVEATIKPFNWSGRNSVSARRHAGVQLAAQLTDIKRQLPTGETYVVAHSHGGSVFSYAMKDHPELVDQVNGFIALATPWLGARASSYAVSFRELLIRLAIFAGLTTALVPLSLLISYLTFLNFRSAGGEYGWAADIGRIQGRVAAVVVYTTAASVVVALLGFLLWRVWLSDKVTASAKPFHDKVTGWAERVNTLNAPLPSNSVFLKPAGDEAALALGWTSAMAALAQSASSLLFWTLQSIRDVWLRVPAWTQLAAGALLSVALLSGSFLAWFETMQLDDATLSGVMHAASKNFQIGSDATEMLGMVATGTVEWAALMFWAALCVFGIMVGLLLSVALLAAAGAGTLTSSAPFLQFWVEAIPAGDRRLVLVEVRKHSGDVDRVAPRSLSHSALYSNALAIEAVTRALAEFRASA